MIIKMYNFTESRYYFDVCDMDGHVLKEFNGYIDDFVSCFVHTVVFLQSRGVVVCMTNDSIILIEQKFQIFDFNKLGVEILE